MPHTPITPLPLHFLEHPGGEPPLVLLPGLTANAHSFDGLIGAGLSPRFRVLALDLRGRGQSPKPEQGYSMAEHAADVLALLDEVGLERVVLGGHSFGAWLTIFIAAHHPERVAALLLMDAAARLHPQVRELIAPSLARLGREVPSWEQFLAAMQQAPPLHGWWEPAIESYFRADVETRADGSVLPRSRLAHIVEAADQAQAEPWMAHIARIPQPTLLLNAPGPYGPPGTPPVLPKAFALETVEKFANARYQEVPGNHITMLYGKGAATMVAAITDFIHDPERATP